LGLLIDLHDPPAKKTSVALGLFDGCHRGHIQVIKRAVERARKYDLAPAVFTFDTNTVTSKIGASERIMTDRQKRDFFRSYGIEYIYSPNFSDLKDLSAEDFISDILVKKMNCGAVFCGRDFTFGKNASGDSRLLADICGGRYGVFCDIIADETVNGAKVSSTRIRELIRDGKMLEANILLGHFYSVYEPVIHGHELGRTMNFPTVNQLIPENTVVPKHGVYASFTEIDGRNYRSITNIGVKPTVEKNSALLAETYIIGYEGDLYGQRLKVSLYDFVRPEMKFGSVNDLFARIASDTEYVKNLDYKYNLF